MPIDRRPLVRIEPYTVLQERHEVLFTDGSTIGLHQVEHDGTVSHYLRCVAHDEVHAIVFDVRDLVPALKTELPVALDQDRQGLVCISMRLAFTCAAHLTAAAVLKLKGNGFIQRDPVQRPLFIFSSGHADFLKPEFANRRFWPVEVSA